MYGTLLFSILFLGSTGTPIVDACVRFGVDYVDITGESQWTRKMIDSYHDQAKANGTIIVPSKGIYRNPYLP